MKKPAKLFYLMRLLELGAKDEPVAASTSFLSKMFEVSQQSASRILTELHDMGYLRKEKSGGTLSIRLTTKAIQELESFRRDLESAFQSPGTFDFEGEVFTGFGEGSYYMSKRPYRRQFYKFLGFDPYPGTLNLRLRDRSHCRKNIRLRSLKGIHIYGFDDEERSYGGLDTFRATIQDNIEGAIIMPFRSAYGHDTSELIAPLYLRRELDLEDGDTVRYKVHLLGARPRILQRSSL